MEYALVSTRQLMRKPLDEMIREPNFFILGAQKAGTTYLAAALAGHPDVFFSSPKELFFFTGKTLTQADYETYLHRHFANASDERWVGEGTTTYLQWPMARKNLKKFLKGSPRFIVCLRQPTAKTVSWFIHNWRRGRYAPGTTLTDVKETACRVGSYAPSIRAWISNYDREHFLFLKFDDLLANPHGFVDQATRFLDIAPVDDVPDTKLNAGLPLTWIGNTLSLPTSTVTDLPLPRFQLEELEKMQAFFRPDLRETEALTGLDLSDWDALPQLAS